MWGRSLRPRLRGSQSGYVLPEVLVVAALLTVVLGAVLLFGDTAQDLVPKDEERAHAIREAQVGVDRMTRELRGAHQVHTAGSYTIEVNVLLQGVNTRVRYECDEPHPSEPDYRRCYRYVVAPDGSTDPGQLVVDRVLRLGEPNPTAPVFSYLPNQTDPTYVEVKVEVPARGDLREGHGHRIALEDGFYMRNRDA